MRKLIIKNPFFIITPITIAGILLGKYFIGYPYSLWISISLLFLYLILNHLKIKIKPGNLIIILLLCFAASLRYNLAADIIPKNHLSYVDLDSIGMVTGFINEYHYKKDGRNQYVLSVTHATISDEEKDIRGKVILTTKNIDIRYRYGDLIQLKGEILDTPHLRNPGQFDYRSYLASKDIYHISYVSHVDQINLISGNQGNWFIRKIIIPIKDYCENIFQSHLNEDTTFLLSALLLGEKQNIDKETFSEFKQVGVVHVLAISGLHVGFIILFVFTLFSLLRLSFNYKIYGLIIILTLYVILVQFKPPVMRASLMAILFLIGRLRERKVSVYNILFGAAFIILLFEPRELFNPGFQFSFLAVFSIIYGYQRFDSILPLRQWTKDKYPDKKTANYICSWIWIPFLVSLSAVLGTLPLTIYYYGIVSTYALFANLIVIPIVGLIVLLGIFLLLTGLISVFLTNGIGILLGFFHEFLELIVKWFSELPYATFDIPTLSLVTIIVVIALVFLLLNFQKLIVRKVLFALGIIVLSYFLINSIKIDNNLEVAFLDVGQGDAVCLVFPNGRTMLIDAGESNSHWDNGEKTILPYLKNRGINRIMYAVASHPHNDHIGGFYTLFNKIAVDTFVVSNFYNEEYEQLISFCKKKRIPVKFVSRGDQLYPDTNCRVYILHPGRKLNLASKNNNSIVMKVQYGENGLLLTGDLERKGESSIIEYERFLESEILKVAHHGSISSTSFNFLKYIRPLTSVISVAKKNKFKHPSPITLDRLKSSNVSNYLTHKEGAIIFNISENKITKVNWRKFW